MTSNNDSAMDVSLSPSTSTQCPENLSPMPSSIKTIYSKLISSCQRSEGLSSSVTPDKEEFRRIVSPFISRKVPFNPFNYNLKERLENPIFSPGVFSTVISPSRDSEEFKWTIDDISKIKPAQIEEEFHYEDHTDEQTESEMQKTIDQYFTKNHMIPSPWDCKLPTSWHALTEIFKKENQDIDPGATSSPCSLSLSHLELVAKTPCQNVSTQTALSLPPDLPESINSALKPYFIENDLDEINLSMNLLRRKLFCQNDDEPYSPVRYEHTEEVSPVIRSYYPSTPVINNLASFSPTEKFSPVDVSPIKRIEKGVKCNNSSFIMQVDSSLQETQSANPMVTLDSMKVDQTSSQYGEECCKVFESPKLAGAIRRNRKRRRSLSQDMSLSVSYSSLAAKQSAKHTIHKLSSCEYKTLTESTSDNLVLSQDTGYGSDCTNSEKSRQIDGINFESTTFECWNKENKENMMIASTPTK